MPYSIWYVVASPLGLTVPVTTAEPVVTDSAGPVVAVRGGEGEKRGERERGEMHGSV